MRDLDREIPYGDPTSKVCRWCYGVKTVVADTLLCRGCDGSGHAIAIHNAGRNR